LEKNLRDKLKNHEVAYSAASWEAVSSRLDAQDKKGKYVWLKWSAAALLLLLISFGGVKYFTDEKSESLAQKNTVEKKTSKKEEKKTLLTKKITEEKVTVKEENKDIVNKKTVAVISEKSEKTSSMLNNSSDSKRMTSLDRREQGSVLAFESESALASYENTVQSERSLLDILRLNNASVVFAEGKSPFGIKDSIPVEENNGSKQVEYLLFNPWNQLGVVGNFDERIRLDFETNWDNKFTVNGNELDPFASTQMTMSYETVFGMEGTQGFGVYYQNQGISNWLSKNRFAAIYSYIVDNKERGKLTVSPSLSYREDDYKQDYWSEPNPDDFEFSGLAYGSDTPVDSISLGFSIGINYEIKRFFLYLNSYNIASFKMRAAGNYEDMSSHYIIGYHIPISKKITLTPILSAVQVRSDMNISPKFFIDVKDVLTAGVFYHNMNQWRVCLGSKFSNRWNLQASYGKTQLDESKIYKSRGMAQLGLYYQLNAR
jgi:hypothetical protein